MSGRPQARRAAPPLRAPQQEELVSPAILRRRAAAAAARRKRLLTVDLTVGAALGLALLLIAPGLAIVALVLLGALAGLLITTVARWLLRRRRDAPRHTPPTAPRRASREGPDRA